MKEFKRIFDRINKRDFSLYLFFSILLLVTLISLGKLNITQAKYESETTVSIQPSLAFFIVDVTNTSGQIKLDGLIPSSTPYTFTFNVSNFNATRHANVDLVYSIEIITTTNMHLNFRIFKGNNQQNEIDSDTTTTDENGVYYRHLVINDASTMNYNANCTDTYTLWVEFPLSYKDQPDAYSGIIDLVDIKINAEQVV